MFIRNFNDRITRAPEGTGGTVSPASAQPVDTSAGEQSTQDSMSDLSKLLNYDFTDDIPADGGTNTGAATEVKTPVGDATKGTPADGAVKDGQPADANKAPEGEVDPIEALKKLGQPAPAAVSTSDELLAKAMDVLLANQKGGAAPTADTTPADDSPKYNFQIPDAILAAVDSQDATERHAGMHALTTGIAVTIHKAVRKEYEEKLGQLFQAIPQLIQEHTSGAAEKKATFDDFYGTYPELKSPMLMPIVLEEAKRLAIETKNTNYSPQFKAALRIRVQEKLVSMATAAGIVPAPNVTPANNGGTPPVNNGRVPGTGFMGGGSARPAVEGGNSIGDEIASMMDNF